MLAGNILWRVRPRCSYFFRYLLYNLCNMLGCACSNESFKLRWWPIYFGNSSFYHHETGSTNIFYCCYILPWFVSKVLVQWYSLSCFIIILGKLCFCFYYYSAVHDVMWANDWSTCHAYFARFVSTIKSTLDYLRCNDWLFVFRAYQFILWWLSEDVCILSSSNLMYESYVFSENIWLVDVRGPFNIEIRT